MPIVKLLSENFGRREARDIRWYRDHGGYEGARKCLFELTPEQVVQEVIDSNLRGLGGAGFPTGRKWTFVPQESKKPKFLVVNADEGEPGTFKDRQILTWDPHRLLEGMMICCYAVGIHTAFIYIRGEYVRPAEILKQAMADAYREGVLGPRCLGKDFTLDIFVHEGAGAYICGEESALLESLEGKKGWPRLRPPFPAIEGLFACPTVINNVETLSHLPRIVVNGGKWFAEVGSPRNGGTRLFCLSGNVKRPGVYELPMGTPLRELIYEHGGGMLDDKALKAVIPGGVSAPVLAAKEIDVPLDFDSLIKLGSMLGSGGVVAMDEDVCMVRALQVISHFFAHESCGQCTPCREGTGWLEKIVTRLVEGQAYSQDLPNLMRVAGNMIGTSICALSDAAALPVRSFLHKFNSEFEYHAQHRRCDVEERKATATPLARSAV
ncbi:MAG: NADH-quinone oxidoreductase subunit NuoF [Acidobacteria bacterium]|nr:NADH-quinone oxidoreductase subunit NuoF [Acidobacteriota bacterium]